MVRSFFENKILLMSFKMFLTKTHIIYTRTFNLCDIKWISIVFVFDYSGLTSIAVGGYRLLMSAR